MLVPRSPCWVKKHLTVVFKDHESGERFGRFGSFSTESCILNCQEGGGFIGGRHLTDLSPVVSHRRGGLELRDDWG